MGREEEVIDRVVDRLVRDCRLVSEHIPPGEFKNGVHEGMGHAMKVIELERGRPDGYQAEKLSRSEGSVSTPLPSSKSIRVLQDQGFESSSSHFLPPEHGDG